MEAYRAIDEHERLLSSRIRAHDDMSYFTPSPILNKASDREIARFRNFSQASTKKEMLELAFKARLNHSKINLRFRRVKKSRTIQRPDQGAARQSSKELKFVIEEMRRSADCTPVQGQENLLGFAKDTQLILSKAVDD